MNKKKTFIIPSFLHILYIFIFLCSVWPSIFILLSVKHVVLNWSFLIFLLFKKQLFISFYLFPPTRPQGENVRLKFKLTNQLILFLTVYYKGVSCNKACKTKIKLTIHSFLHNSKWLAFFLISSVHSVVFAHCTFSLNRNDLFLLANPIW